MALDLAPLRWQLPLHLLEPFMLSSARQEDVHRGPKELQLLQRIFQVIKEGVDAQAIQTSPHFILLNRHWYFKRLRGVLGLWLLRFLQAQTGFSSDLHALPATSGALYPTDLLANEGRLALCCSGQGLGNCSPSALAFCFIADSNERASGPLRDAVLQSFSPPSVQLLNLARDWLASYLPHVLSKVNCVNYGLLTGPMLKAHSSTTTGRVPESRLLLAVPFVGKDVPSATSEFACPEVLIGLTVLAYRYQGLRKRDLRTLVSSLKRRLLQEQGPIQKRPSRQKFDKWLSLALQRRQTDSEERYSVLPLELLQVIVWHCVLNRTSSL